LEEEEEEYQTFLDDEAMAHEPLAVVAIPVVEGATQVRESRLKDFIIIALIVVIVKILSF
jgi:hypothetical protein